LTEMDHAGIVLFVGLVIVAAIAVTVVLDRAVGTAFAGVVVGATWMVRQSAGRWWYWPAVFAASLLVLAALVGAVLLS
jgi:hypothetical protein